MIAAVNLYSCLYLTRQWSNVGVAHGQRRECRRLRESPVSAWGPHVGEDVSIRNTDAEQHKTCQSRQHQEVVMPSGKQKIQSENILYINMDGNILASYNITPGIVINIISKTGQFIQCTYVWSRYK